MSNQMAGTQKQKSRFSVAIATPSYQKLINDTLGDPKRASRFIAAISSAVATNPALQECDAGSILSAALLGESLQLSPSPQLGQYYLVPFDTTTKDANGKDIYLLDENGKRIPEKDGNGQIKTYNNYTFYKKQKVKKAQFQLGYKGYIQLALRSGQYADLDCMEIKEGEYKGRNKYTGKREFEFIEDDEIRENLPTIGYLSYFEYLNGFKKALYWSKSEMEKHAITYSKGYNAKKGYTFWEKDFDEMAKKTMLRQLLSKWGIMSIEIQQALENDTEIIDNNNGIDYPDCSETLQTEQYKFTEIEQDQIDVVVEDTEVRQVNFDEL